MKTIETALLGEYLTKALRKDRIIAASGDTFLFVIKTATSCLVVQQLAEQPLVVRMASGAFEGLSSIENLAFFTKQEAYLFGFSCSISGEQKSFLISTKDATDTKAVALLAVHLHDRDSVNLFNVIEAVQPDSGLSFLTAYKKDGLDLFINTTNLILSLLSINDPVIPFLQQYSCSEATTPNPCLLNEKEATTHDD